MLLLLRAMGDILHHTIYRLEIYLVVSMDLLGFIELRIIDEEVHLQIVHLSQLEHLLYDGALASILGKSFLPYGLLARLCLWHRLKLLPC